MKRDFLSKLHFNGVSYLIGSLLLLLAIPLYQFLVLLPQGYGDALTSLSTGSFAFYLTWVANHMSQFLGYRAFLVLAFACLLSLPFTLFRIIIAQEILGREEKDLQGEAALEAAGSTPKEFEENSDEASQETDGMPAYAWRGKGFAVIAAWSGLFAIALYTFGTLASTIYISAISSGFSIHTRTPDNFFTILTTFTFITYAAGGGLLAIACLFFGAIIARSGRNLWPGIWVAFSYMALALTALLSSSAVAVASAPIEGQAALTSPAILFFALWVLWFGVMLVRLKPEA